MTTTLARDATTTRPWTVVDVRDETPDVVTLDLEPASPPPGGAPESFAPGQFDMLYAFGVGECAISISSSVDDPARRSHTIRRVGAVTDALTGFGRGDTVGIRGPFGRPWPLSAAEGGDLVIVAGGIGLAPVRPAVLAALANRDRYRRVVLLVGARTPQDLVFKDDLLGWGLDDGIEVHATVDRAERGWTGPVGVVTSLVDRARLDGARSTVFTCGPEVMMRFVGRAVLTAGVPPAQVYVSLERTMRCGVGTCGHCQLGPVLVCRDGPVLDWARAAPLMEVREL